MCGFLVQKLHPFLINQIGFNFTNAVLKNLFQTSLKHNISSIIYKGMSSDASTQCSNSCANNGNIVVLKRAHSPEKNIIENESEYKGKKRKLNNGQRKPKEKVIKTDFEDFDFNETSYYIENNLRKVYPYYFTFKSHAKGRWVGKNILDVFKHEFRAHPLEEYKKSIQTGMLTVNNKTVEIDYVINNNDLISNKIHRHEVPVTTKAIEIVHLDDDLLQKNIT